MSLLLRSLALLAALLAAWPQIPPPALTTHAVQFTRGSPQHS